MQKHIRVICRRVVRPPLFAACATLFVCVALAACARGRTEKAATPATQTAEGSTAPVQITPAATPAEPLDARKIIQKRCTVCHGTFRIKLARILPIPARPLVDNMIKRGAQLTPEERSAVIEHLKYW